MINPRVGDVLEIYYEGQWSSLVVLTKIAMFGGNIVFAFHGNGGHSTDFVADPDAGGFNICTDLLAPKKHGRVSRIGKVGDVAPYFKTRLAKGCHEHRPGRKAAEWWIYRIEDLGTTIARVRTLNETQREAMDCGMFSFDLVVEKILSGYRPGDNPFI